VADAYEAMTHDRVYRQARSHEDALDELRRNCGAHFDPRVVEAFIGVIEIPRPSPECPVAGD